MTRRLKEAVVVAVVLLWAGCGQRHDAHQRENWSRARSKSKDPQPVSTTHRARVNLPHALPGINTGRRDVNGQQVRIRCAVCHHLLQPREENKMATRLTGFHTGISIQHGDQTCRTCHLPPLFETFRLGGDQVIPYARVMELCGQCHSGQLKDYQRGIHGGMAGYWDLNSGGRDRNHCLDCHNPHKPAVGQVTPAPRPRYRFLEPQESPHE